jgi:hypothetical protein
MFGAPSMAADKRLNSDTARPLLLVTADRRQQRRTTLWSFSKPRTTIPKSLLSDASLPLNEEEPMRIFKASTRVPTILVVAVPVATLLLMIWAMAVATDRNPLPIPDRDYHVFTAKSEAGLVVLEEIMHLHGHDPRFRADTEGVQRTIFSNGTIINHAQPQLLATLGEPSAALGFVVQDPDASAREVAALLRSRGFQADAIHGAEPGLPIAFVRTDALSGAALVFRKHVLRMGSRPDKWTPRTLAVGASQPE